MTPLVLASSSRYRKMLLQRLQIPFSCQAPDIDESALPGEQPLALVRRLSESKARALASDCPGHLIIGSDQVAEYDGSIITKPGCFEAARQQLQQQSGKAVQFHTGLCLYNTGTDSLTVDTVTTTAHFRQLSDEEIERYLYKEEPYDCAGSFKSEQLGASLLNRMEGPDPTALVGLPLIRLCGMLREQGLQIP